MPLAHENNFLVFPKWCNFFLFIFTLNTVPINKSTLEKNNFMLSPT